MGYTSNNLSLRSGVIGGGAPRQWDYFSADSIATILGAGYISNATTKGLLVGDVVHAFSGTLNTALTATPSTADVGAVSRFATVPVYEVLMVDAISSGAATLKTMRGESITDSSGGTASASAGIVAAATKTTFLMPVQLLDLANSQTWKLAVPFAFSLTSIGFRTGKPASTASKLATLTGQVSGVAVTGGVVSLTTANQNATGTLTAGTAITAGGTGAAGGTIEAAVSSVTTFIEGDGWIEFGVTNVDLANAIATLAKF